jgi:hypothetical protein
MAKPYSTGLRERVVAAVEKAGMSRLALASAERVEDLMQEAESKMYEIDKMRTT